MSPGIRPTWRLTLEQFPAESGASTRKPRRHRPGSQRSLSGARPPLPDQTWGDPRSGVNGWSKLRERAQIGIDEKLDDVLEDVLELALKGDVQVAGRTGLEPATSGVTGQSANGRPTEDRGLVEAGP